mmetsp:Transcript_96733/g.224239  ORF Transcript_96733/g.224239 Transcript_96733/m.224239 type:complete len:206 (-) Transcript_96733:289-906(-)
MFAIRSSISAVSMFTSSVFLSRVCLLVVSSVSHQPLCSASSLASSMRRTSRSLIIFLTLRKGSSATRPANAESTRLLNCRALNAKYSAAFAWAPFWRSERRAASAVAFFCTMDGKYFSAFPDTAALERISIALAIATSSSARSCCRDSKSAAFCSQVAVRSARYFLSASYVVIVSCRSPSASAFACSFLAFVSAFSPRSWEACSI